MGQELEKLTEKDIADEILFYKSEIKAGKDLSAEQQNRLKLLEQLLRMGRNVGYCLYYTAEERVCGNAFHYGGGWMMTCSHVLESHEILTNTKVTFRWLEVDLPQGKGENKIQETKSYTRTCREGYGILTKKISNIDLAMFRLDKVDDDLIQNLSSIQFHDQVDVDYSEGDGSTPGVDSNTALREAFEIAKQAEGTDDIERLFLNKWEEESFSSSHGDGSTPGVDSNTALRETFEIAKQAEGTDDIERLFLNKLEEESFSSSHGSYHLKPKALPPKSPEEEESLFLICWEFNQDCQPDNKYYYITKRPRSSQLPRVIQQDSDIVSGCRFPIQAEAPEGCSGSPVMAFRNVFADDDGEEKFLLVGVISQGWEYYQLSEKSENVRRFVKGMQTIISGKITLDRYKSLQCQLKDSQGSIQMEWMKTLDKVQEDSESAIRDKMRQEGLVGTGDLSRYPLSL